MEIHQLPCEIDFDGEAQVDKFFQVTPIVCCEHERSGHGQHRASFRGRKIEGFEQDLADFGCRGYIFRAATGQEDGEKVDESRLSTKTDSNKSSIRKLITWTTEKDEGAITEPITVLEITKAYSSLLFL